jgi:hypothetical protein
VAVPSTVLVWDSLIAGITSSNPAENVDVRLSCLLRRQRLLRRANNSFREVLPIMCVIKEPLQWGGLGLTRAVAPQKVYDLVAHFCVQLALVHDLTTVNLLHTNSICYTGRICNRPFVAIFTISVEVKSSR